MNKPLVTVQKSTFITYIYTLTRWVAMVKLITFLIFNIKFTFSYFIVKIQIIDTFDSGVRKEGNINIFSLSVSKYI